MKRLSSPEDLAKERFGAEQGLAIVAKTTLELADYYADKYGADKDDPETAVVATALAFTRHKEFTLILEVERDLYKRTLVDPDGADYGRILFKVTTSGAHRDVYREIDRLHSRARNYSQELRQLARETQG